MSTAQQTSKPGGNAVAEEVQELIKSGDESSLAGKYLTFKLGNEEYGLEILKVREIIGVMDITKIPRAPEFIRGVINLRGKVNPIVDTRVKFEMETVEDTELTCIIIVEVFKNKEAIEMGIIVDTVSEVLDIQESEIEDTPEFGGGIDTKFILGMAKAKDGVKILLDINKVLTGEDFKEINKIK
jgi:purine-binding chemotaxis protein CheW